MKLLVLAENFLAHQALLSFLLQQGHAMAWAACGPEALESAHRYTPDLMLLLNTVPISLALEFCRQVKQADALQTIPLVFYTEQLLTAEERQVFQNLGVHGLIEKPLTPVALEETLRAFLPDSSSANDWLRNETHFQALVDFVPVALALISSEQKFLKVNRRFHTLFGYTLADLPDLASWWQKAYPDITERQKACQYWKQNQHVLDLEYETQVSSKDGQVRQVRMYVQHFQTLMVLAFVDHSHFKHREYELLERLRTSERILNATQAITRVGGWEYNLTDQSLWWTDELYALHGLPLDRDSLEIQAYVQKSLSCYRPESAQQELLTLFERCKTTGEGYDREYRFQPYQGPEIWVRTVTQAVYENGHIVRIIGAVMDITAIKQTAEELKQAKERAEAAAKAKSIFLANMSHEIRTPLNAILGFSQLLREQNTNPRWQRYLHAIHSSGQSLLRIINDILDLSKIEAGKLEIQAKPLKISDLCQEIRTLMSLSFEQKGLRFEIRLNTCPEWLELDGVRVRQILLNLLSNALKFTPQGEVLLEVSYYAQTESLGQLVFIVRDTGIGIAKEKQAQIFEAFEQVVPENGTGLGLTITRSLVELMGGTIHLESQLGQGSCFTVILPEVKAVFPAAETIFPLPQPTDFQPATLLLADDVEINLLLIEEMLQPFPFQLYRAYNGLEACELAEKYHPDLILMDIKMPIMNGSEALQRLRSNPHTAPIPVIALTALSLANERQQLLDEGFDGYLSKPIEFSELLKCLQNHLSVLSAAEAEPKQATAHTPSRTIQFLDQQALRTQWLPRWEQIRHSLVVDELESFAHDLKDWADSHGLLALSTWSQRLLEQIQNFCLEAAQTTLTEFPQWLEEI